MYLRLEAISEQFGETIRGTSNPRVLILLCALSIRALTAGEGICNTFAVRSSLFGILGGSTVGHAVVHE